VVVLPIVILYQWSRFVSSYSIITRGWLTTIFYFICRRWRKALFTIVYLIIPSGWKTLIYNNDKDRKSYIFCFPLVTSNEQSANMCGLFIDWSVTMCYADSLQSPIIFKHINYLVFLHLSSSRGFLFYYREKMMMLMCMFLFKLQLLSRLM